MMRSTLEERERIRLQSPLNAVPEPTTVRTAQGDDLSLSQAARQLMKQRRGESTHSNALPFLTFEEITTPVMVWGAKAIALHLGRTTKGAYGALESDKVPGAKKIAGRWGLNLKVFYASFGDAS